MASPSSRTSRPSWAAPARRSRSSAATSPAPYQELALQRPANDAPMVTAVPAEHVRRRAPVHARSEHSAPAHIGSRLAEARLRITVPINEGVAMSEPKVTHIDEIEGAYGGVFKPV